MSFNTRTDLPSWLKVSQTPQAGRSLRAAKAIPLGTVILDVMKPAISVIYKPYRREVCAFCFAYDRGRHWKIRDIDTGFSFCSEICQNLWEEDLGPTGVEAYRAVGGYIAKRGPPKKSKADQDGDAKMEKIEPQPPPVQIDDEFAAVAERAGLIRKARASDNPSKPASKALQVAMTVAGASADVLYLLLSGILCLSTQPLPELLIPEKSQGTVTSKRVMPFDTERNLSIPFPNPTPYFTRAELEDHVTAYLQLLAVLPVSLLPLVTEESCRFLAGVMFHNVFGIRSQDTLNAQKMAQASDMVAQVEEPGSELMGDMLLTTASLINHSCSPNIRKARKGRGWMFWAGQDIAENDECCITYLGGEEKELSYEVRRERLRVGWGFDCACATCSNGR